MPHVDCMPAVFDYEHGRAFLSVEAHQPGTAVAIWNCQWLILLGSSTHGRHETGPLEYRSRGAERNNAIGCQAKTRGKGFIGDQRLAQHWRHQVCQMKRQRSADIVFSRGHRRSSFIASATP